MKACLADIEFGAVATAGMTRAAYDVDPVDPVDPDTGDC